MGKDCGHEHSACSENHDHAHGPGCGHTVIEYDGKQCYLHDGHMHYTCGDHLHCTQIEFSAENPDGCTPGHKCSDHDEKHLHGPNCGHEAVPHGDHVDYLVGGHLHFPHGNHCDDHGPVKIVTKR